MCVCVWCVSVCGVCVTQCEYNLCVCVVVVCVCVFTSEAFCCDEGRKERAHYTETALDEIKLLRV